jgi:methylenetetrahydrofolate reductase (NADPH)
LTLVTVFIAWGRQVRAAGITIPIIPGIMPIQTYASFKRRTAFSKTIISPHLVEMLEPIQGDDQLVREVGTKFVAGMVRKILAAGLGIHGIHCCEPTVLTSLTSD